MHITSYLLLCSTKYSIIHPIPRISKEIPSTAQHPSFHELLYVAAGAALVGRRTILSIHGASPDVLQTVFKAEAGMTPRTVADLQSGERIRRIIRNKLFPTDRINEEESGIHEGTGFTWHIDPVDGTSSYAEGQRYSTVGIALYEENKPKASVICHPFERELLIAEVGKGAWLFPLNEHLEINRYASKIEVSKKDTLSGGIVFLDALFNSKTTPPKQELMMRLTELAKGNLGFRMTGSNIDQQRQVAAGRGLITITDAVGGFFDLAAGNLMLREAGGIMIDGQTGEPISEKTQVAIGGPLYLVKDVLPITKNCYKGYTGFK